jgi:predicted RecA/RadA family phage recombinase
MATTFHQNGDVLDIVAGSAISAGDVVVTGGMIGIAIADIANGSTGSIAVEGVFKVTKIAGEAWVVGDKIGYDASATGFDKTFTPAAGDVTTCGRAAVAAASADTVGYIKLTPASATAGS